MATVAILVVRHPDASNEFTVSTPPGTEVVIIDVDYGSSFDGQPRNAEEAESAISIADSIIEQAAVLPALDPVRVAIAFIADELLGYAEDLGVDIEAVRADNAS